MPTRLATVTIASIGTDAGPFSISDNVLGVIAVGVTRAELLAGYVVSTDVNSTVINVQSTGLCTTSLNIPLPTPTPTPTPTPGPTPSPTETPAPTPIPVEFDPNYTAYSNICGQGGKVWTRLTGPVGSIVELTVYAQHFVVNITGASACISGRLSTTTLPSTTPPESTLLAQVAATVVSANVPGFLSDTSTVNVTIPAAGYQDLILVYRTTNLTAGFSNGSVKATITSINSSPVANGGIIQTTYGCSDAGNCV